MNATAKVTDQMEVPSSIKPMVLDPLPEQPLVSILISNYNYGEYLGDAIESALRQTYDKLEVVICDDGSTDDSFRILERYRSLDRRIKVIYQANGGQSLALNAAFHKSTGDIICLFGCGRCVHAGQGATGSSKPLPPHRMQDSRSTEC